MIHRENPALVFRESYHPKSLDQKKSKSRHEGEKVEQLDEDFGLVVATLGA
jgi:hypothetical protein